MTPFDDIYEMALLRHGDALEARVHVAPKSASDLAETGDDRFLAQMAQRVFSAGFVWSVVEKKWPGFEAAFDGFDVPTVRAYTADDVQRLKQDARIVRNGQKIQATIANAGFVHEVSTEHGSFGAWIAAWPEQTIVELWWALAKRGSRLGGRTGPMFLRFMGKDTFLLSSDVVARLIAEGIVTRAPTSKRDQRRVQDAFVAWREQSGRPFGEISRVLACSIDG